MKPILMFAATLVLALTGGCATPGYVSIEGDGMAVVEPTFYPYYYGGVRVWIDPFDYYYSVGRVIYHYHDYADVIVNVVPDGFYVIGAPIPDEWYRHLGYWRNGRRWHGEYRRHDGYRGNRGRDEVWHRGGRNRDYGRRGGHRIDNAPEQRQSKPAPRIRQRQQRLMPPEPQFRPQRNLAPPKIHQPKPAPRMSAPRRAPAARPAPKRHR